MLMGWSGIGMGACRVIQGGEGRALAVWGCLDRRRGAMQSGEKTTVVTSFILGDATTKTKTIRDGENNPLKLQP